MKKAVLVVLGVVTTLISCSAADGNHELTDADRSQLQRDKLIITGRTYQQVFSPYVYSGKPVFITTDSVLNAWHVLFEESVKALEEGFSIALPDSLDRALDAIPKEAPDGMTPELFEPAARRARLVLGTATKLAGGKWSGGKELDDLIAADVRRAEEARELALPEWLAKEGHSIGERFDYAVFRPAGIYAGNPRMERYFRAVRWLQTVTFDLNRDDHLAAMELVVSALDGSDTVFRIAETFNSLLGGGDSIDAQALTKNGSSYPYDRSEWRSKEPGRRFAVVLAARTLPDLNAFRKTTGAGRLFPKTLEAAVLFGSPLAGKLLSGEDAVLAIIRDERAALKDNSSFYGRYAECLADLFADTEPGAPDFMNSEAWRRKSLNTCLAGWAQFRHAWSLQGAEDAVWRGVGDSNPVGFVEPNPEFFRHLGSLVSLSYHIFDHCGGLSITSRDVSRRAADLIPLINILAESHAAKAEDAATPDERNLTHLAHGLACDELSFLVPALTGAGGLTTVPSGSGMRVVRISDPESLIPVLTLIAEGEGMDDVMKQLAPYLVKSESQSRWHELIGICHQLETLAHKQLRGVEPAEDEVGFIKSYGQRLGRVMLYDGNSWQDPRDDAPRITAVFNQPGHGFLLAGVGRAREIRVLYPWKGREIECHGAVMPFLEMHSDRHLTDAEWITILDGNERPQTPDWLKPVTSQK
jgi:hypothetical protein